MTESKRGTTSAEIPSPSQPGPPGHSWLFGHLKVVGELLASQPHMFHPHCLCQLLKEKYEIRTRYFCLDLWPVADPMLFIYDPEIAAQVTTDFQTPKYKAMELFMSHLAGPGDMVSISGPQWKKWRSVFNPGFAASHLMTLVPMVVDESVIFAEKMKEHAERGSVFRMEEDATRLTVDIIGSVALDTKLNTQRGENVMVTALRDHVHLLPNEFMNPFSMYTPTGIYKRWRNSKIMNEFIGNLLEERFSQRKAQNTDEKSSTDSKKPRARAIIDLALETYLQEEAGEADTITTDPKPLNQPRMDETFKAQACVHIRTFMFAGHDTTSSTICYATYLLQKHPTILQKLRAEHETVLGPLLNTPETIKNNPHILNRLEYTLAVIKEILRLFPPASSSRAGVPGFYVRDPESGDAVPTEGGLLWVVHHAMQRDPRIWGKDAKEFKPERFLPANASAIPEGSWRPFEKGARNCIGQDLALIETKIILALLARGFAFEPAFEEAVDEGGVLARDGSYFARNKRFREGSLELDGEEAFQVLIGTAKPREGMPMRVRVAEDVF